MKICKTSSPPPINHEFNENKQTNGLTFQNLKLRFICTNS